MTVLSWKTNFLGLNIPNKVLSGSIKEVDGSAQVFPYQYWPYPNTVKNSSDPDTLQYPTDPWYGYAEPPNTPVPYQWTVTIVFDNPQQHGSNITRLPGQYTSMDIEVGDFMAGSQDGKVLQIVKVLEKSDSEITCIVEDTLRYNTFRAPDGSGIFGSPGNVVVFNINELGLPLLDPLPTGLSSDFASTVTSRFNWLNPLNNYVLAQTNNGFQKGDAVCIENEEFTLASAENVTKFVGTVLQSGPGPNQFILRPANGIIDFVPGLPGLVGDYLYPAIDGSGDLTLDDASRRPVFMKIAMEIPSFTVGTVANPIGQPDDVYQINGYNVDTVSSTYNVTQAAGFINAKTSLHKVTADIVQYKSQAASNTGQPKPYGIIASFIDVNNPMKASINGVIVTFSTHMYGNIAGDPTLQLPNDWVYDINAANIPNIVASSPDGQTLTITNIIGESITIVNITNDANNHPFAGSNSCSAVSLNTSATTGQPVLRLKRLDGGPINLTDQAGSFLLQTAKVVSGQNGRYALGLNIEQGLRASLNSVVANITARDALYPLVGDTCYVINSNDGNGNYINQWSTWLYNGSIWTLTGRQSSSTVAAKTIQYQLTNSTAQNFDIGTIVTGTRVVSVTVEVTTAFGSSAQLELGYSIANPLTPVAVGGGLMTSSLIDLSRIGMYVTTGDLLFGTNTVTGDVTFTGTYLSGGSSTGVARILISYV